ncbi:MAG: SIMPL domain-containing protein [Rickettsiales bacterium]|jgi:uncharacterized protein YggE|nr:SIMPL domain-containing protein [Rickettsiales bacterium]
MKTKLAKYAIGFAAAIGLVVLADYALGWGRLSRHVSATGVCNAKVARDKFAITLHIASLDKGASASLRKAQAAADGIVRGIRKIDDKTLEIQTTNISSYEKTKWENNTSVLLGVESSIDLEVSTGDRETINAVLDLPEAKGAGVMPRNMRNFSSREVLADATEKCLEAALLDARDKAATIAAADGEKLGRLISAQFGATRAHEDVRPVLLMKAAPASESADYIQSADGDLSITVGAAFGIK